MSEEQKLCDQLLALLRLDCVFNLLFRKLYLRVAPALDAVDVGISAAPDMLLALVTLIVGHSSKWIHLRWHDILHLAFKNSFEYFSLSFQIRKIICLSEENWVAEIQKHH